MPERARVTIHQDFKLARIDERLYSGFLEHLGRAIYSGIYEPGHPKADEQGFRTDVLELVRALKMPLVRYPGGNFVSAYHWEDGVGPREKRPVRLELAWRSRESNQIGTNEFVDWCRKAGTAPMLAVNLGTRGIDAARNLLEYCNHPRGTYWSDLRREHGWSEPHDVRVWCLGNEMDGPWQTGHKNAREYGRLAAETAKAMRGFDPKLELVACGSSHPGMVTFPEWEATVLDECYEHVDYISLHMYFENRARDTASYLARPLALDRYIQAVAGVLDYVKAKTRSRRTVNISFDEWNVWYHSHGDKRDADWPEKPHLLEDAYNFEDVLLVALALNTFIRRADRVKIACIAQVVNVIAPIMTVEGDNAWRQTIYYPLLYASLYGRGTVLQLAVDSPRYDAATEQGVPCLDVSAVLADDGQVLTLFAVNRHSTETLFMSASLRGFDEAHVLEHITMTHPDLRAVNTADKPDTVVPQSQKGTRTQDNVLEAHLPPLSYHVIRVGFFGRGRSARVMMPLTMRPPEAYIRSSPGPVMDPGENDPT